MKSLEKENTVSPINPVFQEGHPPSSPPGPPTFTFTTRVLVPRDWGNDKGPQLWGCFLRLLLRLLGLDSWNYDSNQDKGRASWLRKSPGNAGSHAHDSVHGTTGFCAGQGFTWTAPTLVSLVGGQVRTNVNAANIPSVASHYFGPAAQFSDTSMQKTKQKHAWWFTVIWEPHINNGGESTVTRIGDILFKW